MSSPKNARRRRARTPRGARPLLTVRRRVVASFDGEELAILELALEPDRPPRRRPQR